MLIKKYLGKTLAEMGIITKQQLDEALQRQRQLIDENGLGEKLPRVRLVSDARRSKDTEPSPLLGQVLTEMGFVTEDQLALALIEQKKSFEAYVALESEKIGIAIEIGSLVNSTLNLAEVLQLIMKHANRVTNSVASTLMLLDEQTKELVFSVPTGPKADKLVDIRIPSGKGIAGWVAANEQSVLVPDVKEDSRFYQTIDQISGFETKSILCVPLMAKTKLIGVLEVINKLDGTCFTEEDELLLSMFGYQAASAIETARLYGELKDQLEESRRAAEMLRQSEERYQNLYDHAPDMYFTIKPDGIIVSVNQFGADYLGYSPKELVGSSVQTIIYENDLGPIQRQIDDIFNKKLPESELEFRKVRKDGSIIWVQERTRLVLDKNDTPSELWIICRDITARKQADAAILKSEKKYRDLVENINDIIYELDNNGMITYISKVAETISGYSQNELMGRNIFDFIHKEDQPRMQQQFQKIASGQLEPSEYRFIKKSGEIIWIRSSSRPIYEEGYPVRLRGTALDISETKKIEDQLRHAQKMETVGVLAGGIAHEFNNILGIIIGNTELAMDDVPKWNPARDCLDEIRTASLRAKAVVKQILSFARKTPLQMEAIEISTIITESLKLMRSTIPTTIELRQNISCKTEMIMANPTEINQVLMNLCTNSVHAIGAGPGILEVILERIQLDDQAAVSYEGLAPGYHVKLIVKDNGEGIDPEIINHIIDPFFTTKDVDKGSGMGLSIAYGIIKKHNGAMNISSEVGKGTVVEVLFPIVDKEAQPQVKEAPEESLSGTERILFVDDEASLVKLAQQILGRQGYEVTGKTSSMEALKLFQTEPDQFDLVITDMAMPQMAGDQLTMELIKVRPNIPIILCTGHSDCIDEEKAKALGVAAYTMKPLVKTNLAGMVRKVLDAGRSKA